MTYNIGDIVPLRIKDIEFSIRIEGNKSTFSFIYVVFEINENSRDILYLGYKGTIALTSLEKFNHNWIVANSKLGKVLA